MENLCFRNFFCLWFFGWIIHRIFLKFSSENTEHSDREKKIQKRGTLKQNILHEKMNKLTTLLLLLILVVSFAKDSTSRFKRSMVKGHSCSQPPTTDKYRCHERRHGPFRKHCHFCGDEYDDYQVDDRWDPLHRSLENRCVAHPKNCRKDWTHGYIPRGQYHHISAFGGWEPENDWHRRYLEEDGW